MTVTRFAFCRIGRASATARDAGRLKSQAISTVSRANASARFRGCGIISVGRPEPKIIASAHHCSTLSPSGRGTIVRSRRRAYSTSSSGTSGFKHRSSIRSWKTPCFSAASRKAVRRLSAFVALFLDSSSGHRLNIHHHIGQETSRSSNFDRTSDSRNLGSNSRCERDRFLYRGHRCGVGIGRECEKDILDSHRVPQSAYANANNSHHRLPGSHRG